MSDPLYSKDLLRLAANAFGAGRISKPHATGMAHNPTCGDKVVVDLLIENHDRVSEMAHDTRACVITQASAAILGSELPGLTRDEVVALRGCVADMLTGRGSAPGAPFDVFSIFEAFADHTARHKCVLLPFDAVLAAFAGLEKPKPDGERIKP